jgi:hypothetical protein
MKLPRDRFHLRGRFSHCRPNRRSATIRRASAPCRLWMATSCPGDPRPRRCMGPTHCLCRDGQPEHDQSEMACLVRKERAETGFRGHHPCRGSRLPTTGLASGASCEGSDCSSACASPRLAQTPQRIGRPMFPCRQRFGFYCRGRRSSG